MNTSILKTLLAGVLLVIQPVVQADDTDLFVGNPAATSTPPNVLIILDNTANWNTPFAVEKQALIDVIGSLDPDEFRVGLMMFTESGGQNKGNDGGYVRAAIRPFTAANKLLYQNLVGSLDKGDDKSNGGKVAKTMEEAYLYFSAGTPHSGNQKVKADYTGNTGGGTAASNAIYALSGNALASKNATTYVSPIADGCAKNFIIYISNGAAQDNNSDITQATNALAALGGSTAEIAISPSGSQNNPADQWARFMKQSSYGITTYTIDIDKVTTGQGPGWSALLESMANVSDGKYFDVSSAAGSSGDEIANALKTAFSEIQAVNSVFASVSLPVSVNTQGTYLNQVYVGMFRPDGNSAPRWAGNIKQYKLGYLNGTLGLQDADSSSAINNNTGFVAECARSFWTPSTTDNYWAFKPQGQCLVVSGAKNSNYPDGNVVEKGGEAYMLRNSSNAAGRTVYTCGLASCAAGTPTAFNNSNVSASDLGVATTSERDALINWGRGQDVDDEDTDAVTTAEMRPSVHGDVVHSRPVAINYGSDTAGSRQVVVFYGANDGMLHAINGNRPDTDNTSIGGKVPGQELWSFMPPEFYTELKRLRDNEPLVAYPGQAAITPTPLPKNYGMDGPVAAYKNGATSWIFATMRRGGRNIYAFDVSTPQTPTLLWRRGCPYKSTDANCSTGFEGMGQTWAAPRTMTAGYAPTTPLLIVGGGYDSCEDTDTGTVNHSCTSSSKGRKIFVINAATGALVRAFDTDRGVVGDVVVVPDANGHIKYAYAADLGGNVYRISGTTGYAAVTNANPADWTITKIASLGCATPSSCSANRKFMFAPSVVADDSMSPSTYYLLLGAGDREKPLSTYTATAGVSNYFFMLKDQPTVATWLTDESTNCNGSNLLCLNSLTPILTSATPTASDLNASKGWYLGLTSQEQVVTSAVTVFDTVTFSTHEPTPPAAGVCTTLGTARVYNIDYSDASSRNDTTQRSETIVGGGLPPSPVTGMVTLDDGSTVPFLIGGDPDSPLEGGEPPLPAVAAQPKARVFWNIEK